MKRILLLASFGIAVTCLGQGTVNWGVLNPGFITAQTNSTQWYGGGPAFGGTVGDLAPAGSGLTYYFELLYNTNFTGSQVTVPDYATLFGGTWQDTGLTATNSIAAGRLTPVNPNTAAVVPWANSTTNNIMLVGWSANLGNSWLQVSNILASFIYGVPYPAFFGESATGYIRSGTSNPGVSVFGNGPISSVGLPIYSLDMQLYLVGVPEPSMLALAGLCGLSLLLFRRGRS